MEEFLREYYSFLTKTVEITAAVAGIVVFKRYKNTEVKYFIYFLVYVALLELIGAYPRYFHDYDFLKPFKEFVKGTWAERNYWWYNIFWNIGGPLFYCTYFLTIIRRKAYKSILGWIRLLFVVSAVLYIAFNFDDLFSNSIRFNDIFGAIVVLLSSSLYFLEILQSDRILSFFKSINFYIAAVIFIWFLVLTPITFYNIYFSTADWIFIFLKWQIYLSMNIFMYLTFTFVLLWCKPQNV